MKKQSRILKSILESMGDGVVVADEKGKFLTFNPAAERMLGMGLAGSDPNRAGERYELFMPDSAEPLPASELPLVRAMRGEEFDGVEMLVRNRQVPKEVSISITGRPLQDEDGVLRGGVIVLRDITARKIAEEKLARQALADLSIRLQQSGGTVEIGPMGVVEADPTQMRLLSQNLLGNALKFHQPGKAPRVKVFCRENHAAKKGRPGNRSAGGLVLFVEDDGIGFDEKLLSRLFVPFQRLHGRQKFEGSGMGLAICRCIAERHGGTITASSAAGKGSTFMVSLPFKQPVAADCDCRGPRQRPEPGLTRETRLNEDHEHRATSSRFVGG